MFFCLNFYGIAEPILSDLRDVFCLNFLRYGGANFICFERFFGLNFYGIAEPILSRLRDLFGFEFLWYSAANFIWFERRFWFQFLWYSGANFIWFERVFRFDLLVQWFCTCFSNGWFCNSHVILSFALSLPQNYHLIFLSYPIIKIKKLERSTTLRNFSTTLPWWSPCA